MPRQNRVTPEGQIIADPARGLFMGNRGILHDSYGQMGKAMWRHKAWICCALSFKGRQLALAAPGHYTQLFFLDEAVALAAGHRPCAECRRADYTRFRAAWGAAGLGQTARATEIDHCLHRARVNPGTRQQITCRADIAQLPDGCFIRIGPHTMLVSGSALYPFSMAGYLPPSRRPVAGEVTVLTPAPMVAVLRAGYRPIFHPSAG